MSYFLGMDAGGSTTFAVITDEQGNVQGIGKSGNGNHQINREVAEGNIIAATNKALLEAGLSVEDITSAWFGIAGGDRESDFVILRSIIRKLNLPAYDVSGDTMIALRAGTTRPNGIVVICGTGVNCAGINKQQATYQCGGFGFMYGDFGGGGCLSVEVFRAVVREWDGRGKKTLLTNLTLEMLNYASVEEMYHDFLDKAAQVPKDLTRLLFPALEQGDEIARDIVKLQGVELGLSTQAVINHLEMHDEEFDVVLAGSVVTRSGNDIIENTIKSYASEIAPKTQVVRLTVEPVVGALLLAMERAGNIISDDVYEKLSQITDIGVS